jgi:hypothetical protein
MTARFVRPVPGPVMRPKSPHAHSRQRFDGLALVGRKPAAAPVADRLNRGVKRTGQGGSATGPFGHNVKHGVFGHAAILHAKWTSGQHSVMAVPNNPPMDKSSVWTRVLDEAELHAKGRGQQWLVEQLSAVSDKPYTIQRVQNWKTRGVPRGEYPALALALGKTIDWVAGLESQAKRQDPTERDADAEMLEAFHALPRFERDALRAQIMERAALFKAYLAEVKEAQRKK